ncbi:RagB/SusD family nutrient uptake outer membrane protein [Labilibaculum antarcticum]|uniref:RagB/SusD family nutrient uptake outer membrane protein n=1 Tax=Labilibaculum antarcticum TaxID=1717717 RepID=A0A1Y1CI22_9BACT|nr:RagB/SusD family nutrient uptake outer membrane protein [Labilibaculum antarcticum]BAX79984.1 RagB/SusD family nutrient uptake outer membrane protein [Labilibaculum antarcticum]
MKNIRLTNFVVAAFIVFIVWGCSESFTDLTPKGSATEGNYWQTEDDALAGANAMYYYMKDEDMFTRGFMWYINASDDMITGRSNAKADAAVNFTLSGDEGYFSWMYPQSYKIVRRANDVISHVPDIEMDASLSKRVLGEAYFMRAFHYFWLAHTYGDNGENGGVPIVTEENMFDDHFTRPVSVINNYEQIISDLEKAVDLLPLFTTYASADLGRAHKDAALAYIAKTYMYWAQYDNSKWDNVIEYCDKITNSGSGRKLLNSNNPGTDYHDIFTYQQNFGSEYIWSVISGVDAGSKLPGVMLENKGWGDYNGWGYYQPTLELYNSFEVGDVRRKETILEFGQEFKWFGETRRYTSQNSQSGFQFNKYMDAYGYENPVGTTINANGDDPTTIANVPLIRYTEIVLMKAEALLMKGQNADKELNAVRSRAGLASITNATLSDLKHERRVEFAGEFTNRHFDLVRWHDADLAYNKTLHGRDYSDKTNPDSPFTIKEVRAARPQFDPNIHHVWIIPNDDVAISGIRQNKGWN